MCNEIERMRNDLDVIQEAIGAKLPFGRKDVGLNLLLAAAGVLTAIIAWVVPKAMIQWSVLPILAAAIPMLMAMRKRSMDGSLQAARRREYRLDWLVCVVILAIVIPYLLWERHQGVSSRLTAAGACVLFSGMTCAVLGLTSPGRRCYWGSALPLIMWGFLIPGESLRQMAVGCGITCIFAGLLAAAIQAWQLRREERA